MKVSPHSQSTCMYTPSVTGETLIVVPNSPGMVVSLLGPSLRPFALRIRFGGDQRYCEATHICHKLPLSSAITPALTGGGLRKEGKMSSTSLDDAVKLPSPEYGEIHACVQCA